MTVPDHQPTRSLVRRWRGVPSSVSSVSPSPPSRAGRTARSGQVTEGLRDLLGLVLGWSHVHVLLRSGVTGRRQVLVLLGGVVLGRRHVLVLVGGAGGWMGVYEGTRFVHSGEPGEVAAAEGLIGVDDGGQL